MAEPPEPGSSDGASAVSKSQSAPETKARPSLKDLLSTDEARTDDLVPLRRRFKLRSPPTLD